MSWRTFTPKVSLISGKHPSSYALLSCHSGRGGAIQTRAVAKELHFNKGGETLKRMQAGVDKLASVVGVTLGPKGRNVVLESKCVPCCSAILDNALLYISRSRSGRLAGFAQFRECIRVTSGLVKLLKESLQFYSEEGGTELKGWVSDDAGGTIAVTPHRGVLKVMVA